jgi:hypothetical protein
MSNFARICRLGNIDQNLFLQGSIDTDHHNTFQQGYVSQEIADHKNYHTFKDLSPKKHQRQLRAMRHAPYAKQDPTLMLLPDQTLLLPA